MNERPSIPKPSNGIINRRSFLGHSLGAGAALGLGSGLHASARSDWLNAMLPPDRGFTIVGIPDMHVDFMCTVDNPTIISDWIVARAQRLGIRFVAQLGDAGDRRGSGSIADMLAACRRGFAPLAQAGIPVSVCMGNHDYDRPSSLRANSAWTADASFGASFYQDMRGLSNGIYRRHGRVGRCACRSLRRRRSNPSRPGSTSMALPGSGINS